MARLCDMEEEEQVLLEYLCASIVHCCWNAQADVFALFSRCRPRTNYILYGTTIQRRDAFRTPPLLLLIYCSSRDLPIWVRHVRVCLLWRWSQSRPRLTADVRDLFVLLVLFGGIYFICYSLRYRRVGLPIAFIFCDHGRCKVVFCPGRKWAWPGKPEQDLTVRGDTTSSYTDDAWKQQERQEADSCRGRRGGGGSYQDGR